MGSEVSVHQLGEGEFGEWTRLVEDSPEGSVYSLPAYLDALCRTAGGRFAIVAVRRGQELVGGVGLYERDSRWGRYVAPRLLLHYNGVVLRHFAGKHPSEQTARHLKTLEALCAALARRGYARLALHCTSAFVDARPFTAAGWSAGTRYTYLVPIADLGQAWARVEHNLQRLVHRCEREGMVAAEDQDFSAFLRLHQASAERKRIETYLPPVAFGRFFELLHQGGLCRLFHARLPDGRPVASQLVLLGPGRASYSVAAAAAPEALTSGASAFLRWRVFELLSAAGCQSNDLTDATLNSVTHFKSQLGGDLRLSLELEAPATWRYRLGHAATTRARRWLRRAAPARQT